MDMAIIGERFGKLVVIGPSPELRYGCHAVLFRCDFGEMISVPPFRVWSGQYSPVDAAEGSA